ncbi:hypothetical protein [Streptomyces sp. NPDC059708]|uniref:hypothetical protein n=1 Tax=Streptomyces sp. NPDC059708 TaxID=3346916 RepID=UPI0036B9C5B5
MSYFSDRADDRHFRSAIVSKTVYASRNQTTYQANCSECHVLGSLDKEPEGCAPNEAIIDELIAEHRAWHKAGLKSGRPAPNPAQCVPRWKREGAGR